MGKRTGYGLRSWRRNPLEGGVDGLLEAAVAGAQEDSAGFPVLPQPGQTVLN